MLNEAFNPYGALEELQETNEFQAWIGELQRTDRNLYRKIESEKLKLMVGLGDRKFEREGVYAYRYHGQPSAFR